MTNLVVHNTLYLAERNFMVTVTGLINSFTFIVDGLTDSFIFIWWLCFTKVRISIFYYQFVHDKVGNFASFSCFNEFWNSFLSPEKGSSGQVLNKSDTLRLCLPCKFQNFCFVFPAKKFSNNGAWLITSSKLIEVRSIMR